MAVRMVCSAAVIFAALAIAALVGSFFPDFARLITPLIIFGVGLPLMLLGFYYADNSYKEFQRLICSHCKGNLHRNKSVVVATGNCPICGRRVLVDESIGT